MDGTIKVDGKDVKFRATAATIRKYRQKFGRDFLVDFRLLEKEMNRKVKGKNKDDHRDLSPEALVIFENLAYIMAKQADPDIPDDPDDWLDEFDMFSIYIVLPQIVELWKLSELPTAEQKKKQK